MVLVCSLASSVTLFDIKPDENIEGLSFKTSNVLSENEYEGLYYFQYLNEKSDFYMLSTRDLRTETSAKEHFEKYGEGEKCNNVNFEGRGIKRCIYTNPDTNELTLNYYFLYENFIIRCEAYGETENDLSTKEFDLKKLFSNVLSKVSKSKEEEKERELKQMIPSASIKAPNVITKRVTAGTLNVQDGEIVFEISNEDPNHKLIGYLSCDIPSDVIVTGSMGAATGEQAQYIGQTFTVDPAPARESMSLRLSSQHEGSKYISCSVNYVLFKEGKGYVTSNGQYSTDKKYQQVTVNRDVQFVKLENKAKINISNYWHFIAGGGVLVLLIIIFLVYKLGHVLG